jgi:hypothetical protein
MNNICDDVHFIGVARQHRLYARRWFNGDGHRFLLAIGLCAGPRRPLKDDPTMQRADDLARTLGYDGVTLVCAADYSPKRAEWYGSPGILDCSPDNLRMIRTFAKDAEKVVAIWGDAAGQFIEHARDVYDVLMLDKVAIQAPHGDALVLCGRP